MHILALLSPLIALVIAVSNAAPAPSGTRPNGVKFIDKIHPRAPVPIPSIAILDPHLLHKRDDSKDYTFGAYKTDKLPTTDTKLEAPFNETAGSTWCNLIADVGDDKEPHNQITAATINSHLDWPEPEKRPPEYVCFFYSSRRSCDPHDGHAEYVESVPGPKGSANETEFDKNMGKYVTWACQWHPLNKKSTKGGTGWP